MGTGSSGSGASRSRPTVDVLRVGHRPGRDPRLTTHLALVARAFGARRMYLHPPDPAVAQTLERLRTRWGGTFEVVPAPAWRTVVRAAQGPVVHLTMYGMPLSGVLPKLDRSTELLLVVGGAKVPPQLYGSATYNVAVGNQPHSEVAALAVTLERLLGLPGSRALRGARQRIVPSVRGKTVRTTRGGA